MRKFPKALAPLSALGWALLLTACAGTTPPVQIRVERVTPPKALLTCAPDPAVPATNEDDPVAGYVTDLWEAGEDCRAKVKALRDWSAGQ